MFKAWPIETVETEFRRLKMLQYLEGTPAYEAAASVMRLHCGRIGVPTNADQAVAAIAWLDEMELVTTRDYQGEPIARLTNKGREVATGATSMPGVIRPDP